MFDIEWDPADPWVDRVPLGDDEPEMTEAEYDAMVAELIAADPERREPLTIGQILQAGESEPLTPELIGQLQSLDVSSLDAAQATSYSRAWQRVVNHGQAQLAAGIARVVRAYPVNPIFDRFDGAARELEAALRLGPRQTSGLMATSLDLTGRLTATWTQLHNGALSWVNADILAQATAGLDDAKTQAVQAAVLPKAGERTSSQHRDATRRAVDRIDPDGAEDRRKKARADIRMIRAHYGHGMGQLLLEMTSEQVDMCWTAADGQARQLKAAGDPRTLDQLRCAAVTGWAISHLFHGDGSHCTHHCTHPGAANPPDNDGPDDEPPGPPAPPSRQGRPVELDTIWDLTSLLGLTNHCGELLDSGATLPPGAMRDLLTGGVRLRRMVIDPDTGELLDLTADSWQLPATTSATHRQPICVKVIVDRPTALAFLTGDTTDLDPQLLTAVDTAHPTIRAMLTAPLTAEDLDTHPDAEQPSAALSEFTATRDRYPTNPAAGPSPAKAADREHTRPRRTGGTTTRDNVTSVVRRWHTAKTHGHWKVLKTGRDWQWTSPLGRTYATNPYDYRLGP
jgi:hypothetical protein